MLRIRLNPYHVTAVYPYLDTLEMFFPAAFAHGEEYRREVRGAVRNCHDRYGGWSGQRFMVQRPNPDTVLWLDYLAQKFAGIVRRFDVAYDLQAEDCAVLRRVIETQALLRWQPTTNIICMHEVGNSLDANTLYWGWSNVRPLRRNLILYSDRACKITGEFPNVHAELRFMGAAVVRQEGILRPRDLLTLNPCQLFHKHLKFSDAGARFVKRRLRAEVVKDRHQHHGHELSPFMDQYRASLARRVETMLRVAGWHRSQKLKHEGVMEKRLDKPLTVPFTIPQRLVWERSGNGGGGIET
jgi:hypothetical protein